MAHKKILIKSTGARKISQEDFAKALGARPFVPSTDEEKAKYRGQTSAEVLQQNGKPPSVGPV